jgi:hypothetical protein
MEPKTHLQICGMPSLIAPKAKFMSNRSEEKRRINMNSTSWNKSEEKNDEQQR